jgi:tRNA(fMet)-specific endonuclease VapC
MSANPEPRFMLDTNMLSQLIRTPNGVVAQRLMEVGENRVHTSIIVACELRYGGLKKASPALTARIESVLASIEVSPLDVAIDRIHASLRCELERDGRPIGGNDLLIAAHAIELDSTLVTDNVAEFERVRGLRCANWLKR